MTIIANTYKCCGISGWLLLSSAYPFEIWDFKPNCWERLQIDMFKLKYDWNTEDLNVLSNQTLTCSLMEFIFVIVNYTES